MRIVNLKMSCYSEPMTKEYLNPAKLILKDDFEGKVNDQIWEMKRMLPYQYEMVENAPDNGGSAIKITVRTGDHKELGASGKRFTERAELGEREEVVVPIGNPLWYQYSFYLPEDFLIVKNRLVISQWKQYAYHMGSPSFSIRYIDGELIYRIISDNIDKKFKTKIDLRGAWHTLLVHYQQNIDQTGFARSWLDDKQMLNYEGEMDYYPAVDRMFFKMGLYRDELDEPQTIYFNRFRRGPTKESVIID